jgi:hypothetical protein
MITLGGGRCQQSCILQTRMSAMWVMQRAGASMFHTASPCVHRWYSRVVLGIESSFDDTSVALVTDSNHVLAHHAVSQRDAHARLRLRLLVWHGPDAQSASAAQCLTQLGTCTPATYQSWSAAALSQVGSILVFDHSRCDSCQGVRMLKRLPSLWARDWPLVCRQLSRMPWRFLMS